MLSLIEGIEEQDILFLGVDGGVGEERHDDLNQLVVLLMDYCLNGVRWMEFYSNVIEFNASGLYF